MEQILADANHVAHDHKRRLRDAELQTRTTTAELHASRAVVDDLQRRVQDLVAEMEALRSAAVERESDITRLQDELNALRSRRASVDEGPATPALPQASTAASSITALQPTRRMPYARWLEIEGLRESIRKRDDDVAPSWMTAFERGATDSGM
ncbi:hypothetical protein ATCC90586_011811 [Pythium insidiosum]|nr:hypothetical protein ATCC90586_011811 [Pythium insidiosum]